MLNSKSLIKLSAGLLLLSAVAAPKAHAQSVDVPFTGTTASICTFGTPVAGTLAKSTPRAAMEGSVGMGGFAGGVGTAGSVTVTCAAGGSVTTAVPTTVSVPAGFTAVTTQALVQRDGFTAAADYTSSPGVPFDTISWNKPTAALALPASPTATKLNVAMVTGTSANGTPLTGNYSYNVRLTVVGN